MRIKPFTVAKALMLIVCFLMVLVGFAYVWHYVPAGDFYGVEPPEQFYGIEGWKDFNELTGWALLFSGFTTLFFVLFIIRKIKTMRKFLALSISAMAISLFIAALALELVQDIIIN